MWGTGKQRRRPPAVRQADRIEILQRYVRGETLQAIALSKGIPMAAAEQDLAAAMKPYRDQYEAAKIQVASDELARLSAIEAEAWQAWIDSRRERTKSSTKTVVKELHLVGKDEAGNEIVEEVLVRERRDGNPAFLERVCWCVDRRIKLLGLDAPAKVDIEILLKAKAVEAGLDPTEVVGLAQQFLLGAGKLG